MKSTRAEVKRRLKRGQSVRSIAHSLDLSPQAVYGQIKRMRRDGELPDTDDVSIDLDASGDTESEAE